jgi:hypothetical protein
MFLVTQAWLTAQFALITAAITKGQSQIMASINNILAAQAAEKADLATLVGLIPQLLAAFANGEMTPAQAASVLAEMQTEDATIQSQTASVQAALNPPTPPAGS